MLNSAQSDLASSKPRSSTSIFGKNLATKCDLKFAQTAKSLKVPLCAGSDKTRRDHDLLHGRQAQSCRPAHQACQSTASGALQAAARSASDATVGNCVLARAFRWRRWHTHHFGHTHICRCLPVRTPASSTSRQRMFTTSYTVVNLTFPATLRI